MKTYVKILLCLLLAGALCSCGGGPSTFDRGRTVYETILSRKSVRQFSERKVSRDTIEMLLRAAMSAPSGRDVRPWSFVVLEDKSRFEEVFTRQNFNLDNFLGSAAVIVVCIDTLNYVRNADGERVLSPNRTWRDDAGAATENLLLCAEGLGLGAVWTASYPYKERYLPVKKGLGLPPEVIPYSMVPIGYPAGQLSPKDKWRPDRIHWEKW